MEKAPAQRSRAKADGNQKPHLNANRTIKGHNAVNDIPSRSSDLAHNGSFDHLLHLQRTLGNRAVGRFLQAKQRSRAKADGNQKPHLNANRTIKGHNAVNDIPSRSSDLAHNGSFDHLLHLQRTLGNRAVGRFLQAKLTVSHPDDPYEREAGRVADTVMSMPEPTPHAEEETPVQTKPLATQISRLVQRESQPPLEEEEEKVIATNPIVQRVPVAVREDDEEEKVAPELEPDAALQEEEKLLQSTASIQRQMEDEDEEKVQKKPLSGLLFRIPEVSPISVPASDGAVQRLYTEYEGEKKREEEKPAEMVQRKSVRYQLHDDHDEEEQAVQPKGVDSAPPSVMAPESANIRSLNHGWSPLSLETRAFFEARFGADFSQVRVHTDPRAAETAKSINARAFTVDRDIAFGGGQYAPESHEGQRLLAHELTHVVQQTSAARPQVATAQPAENAQRVEVQKSATTSIQRAPDDTWQEAKQRALAIKDALLDHWTEDEEKALNQIRNQSVLMIKEIRAQYKEVTGDRSLVSDFEEYTSSGEFKEALSYLNAALPLEDRLLANINRGWLFNTENEQGMLEVLRNASRPELDEAATKPSVMDLLRNSLNDDEYYQARKLLTPKDMYEVVVERIRNAKSFWGDDESASYNVLLDLTPEQRRRLWEENEQIFSFMSADEKASAQKICLGTEAEALKERVKVATEGWGTDDEAVTLVTEKTQSAVQQEQAIKQAIASGKTPDGKLLTPDQLAQLQARQREFGDIQQNLLTAEYEGGELKSGSFLEMLNDDVSTEEYQAFAGTMGVSQYQLAKQQILDAIGTFSDDEEAIYKAFDRLVGQIELPPGPGSEKLTPEQRAQAQKLANQKLRQQLLADPDVKKALEANLNEEERKEVDIYASADTYQIALKKLEAAYHGVDTDEEGIFKILTEMSAADRKRMKEEQPRIYYDLLYAPSSALTSEEQEMAKIAIDTGKIPTEKALNWAFGGWGDGTEEEMLEQTFAAMDETERYEYRLGYFLFKGGSLEATTDEQRKQQQDAKAKFGKLYERMDAELGTDELQKALDQLLGTPTLEELKTEQGRLMAAGIMGYRVGEKGDIREDDTLSSAIMDTFSESGEVSDQSEARFVSAYRLAMADGKLTDEEFAALAALDADFARKYEAYVASVDQVANIASTVAAIAVGIVVTVATGGTAGPAAASLLSQYGAAALVGGVAGAATKVGVSEAVGGEHYDTFSTEGLTGAVSGFADGAVAVLSAGLAARFTSLIGLGKSALAAEMTTGILLSSNAALVQAGKTFVSAGVRSTIEGFLAGAVGEVIMTTADAKTWKQSIWGVIQTYGLNILKGGGIGAATGLITGGTLEALGTYVGVKRVQALVGQLEAAGLSQKRMSVMSLRSVQMLGEADAALAAGKLDEAEAALTALRGEMSPEELNNVWQTLGRHHTAQAIRPLFPGVIVPRPKQSIDLAAQERLGGHSIERHGEQVSLTELRQRVLGQHPTMPQSRTALRFINSQTHADAVEQAYLKYQTEIQQHFASGGGYREWTFDYGSPTGVGFTNIGTRTNPISQAINPGQTTKVTISFNVHSGPEGFYLVSAFPAWP